MQGELDFEDWWSMKRLLVTGSRTVTRSFLPIMELELATIPKNTIIAHGGQGKRAYTGSALYGADVLFDELAREAGYSVMEYKANWKMHGRAAGPMRNELMFDEFKPDRVLAFWDGETRGTLNCMNLARSRGKLIRVVYTVPFPKNYFPI